MKNNIQTIALALLLSAQHTTFCASMAEAQTESTPSAAEHLSLTYLYNPVLPLITALSPESIAAIKTCINDPEWVQDQVQERFPTDEKRQRQLSEVYRLKLQERFPGDEHKQQTLVTAYKQRLQAIFVANKKRQQELTAAYDSLNAFLKFSKVPDLAQQLTPKTLTYINIDITRSGPTPGLSNHATLCDGKDPSLQEGVLIDHLQHHLKRLEQYEVYNSKNDTLNIPKLIEFMRHAEFLAKRGINGIRIPYLQENSTLLDEKEIKRWAEELGNPENINASDWLEKHEPHFHAKMQLAQRMELFCTTVNELPEPIDQVVAVVLGIVGYRPFADGNKRTAWLLAHIFCAQNNLILKPLIKGTNEYEEYHRLLDALSTLSDDNANTEEAIHEFFQKRILPRRQSSPRLLPTQSAQVIGITMNKQRFTSFPQLFFQHPTLHDGIFFSQKQLGEAFVIAQKPTKEQLAAMKQKYPHFWVRKVQQEAIDWVSALLCCSKLLTKGDFVQNATIPVLTEINAAVLSRAGVSKFRSGVRLWNWISGGNLHWANRTITPQELAMRVFLLVPAQTKKFIDCGVYDPDSDCIDTNELIKFFGTLCHIGTRRQILGATSFSVKGEEVTFKRVNHDQIERWASEQGLTGKFKAGDWLRKRSFEFSEPMFIQWQLKKTLPLVRKEIDGLNKAFTLLLGIIDLCPYMDGNKRTAQLAASIILLQHGFAPLIIDKKGAKLMNAYTVARKDSPEKRNFGYRLRAYCISQIKKYQALVDHELGEKAATAEPFNKTETEQAFEEFIAKAAAATSPESDLEPSKTEHNMKTPETNQPAKSSGSFKNSGKKKKKKKKKNKGKGKR